MQIKLLLLTFQFIAFVLFFFGLFSFLVISDKVYNLLRMNRDDRLCWYHKSLARDDAEDLLKHGEWFCSP